MKRRHDGESSGERPVKVVRIAAVDRVSHLSDELLLRILSFASVPTLILCQRISRKFYRIANDSQLWKAAYYNRFVRPRASRIPGVKDVALSSEHLSYSSKLSKWLDEENLVRRGQETNWKRQYKLRHNWSQGKCAVSEIPVSEKPPTPPLLVRMHNSFIFTVDSNAGLRAWTSKKDQQLVATMAFTTLEAGKNLLPTSLAVNSHGRAEGSQQIAVGFEDGGFSIYDFREHQLCFVKLYEHASSSSGLISGIAYASPYLLTMTESQLLSLYIFPSGIPLENENMLHSPRLLYSLRSHTVWPPLSLTIRVTSNNVTASIAYALPTYLSGWSVGIQEMRLSLNGELIESRLASAADEIYHSLAGQAASSSPTRSSSPSPGHSQLSVTTSGEMYTKPTSLSYSHPYLLVSHPDNTLTLYLVTSTTSSLSISPGSRLWGHTSSVSGAHVGGRGKAVSVSCRGDELRVWELEGGIASSALRKRLVTGDLSVRLQPEKDMSSSDLDIISDAISQRGSGLGLALEHRFDDLSVTRGWVGFDEENVIVLQEKSQGSQALVVYDFT